MFAFPRWPHISPRNLFSSPFHSRFIFPPKLWIFSDGFLLSELKYRRKLQHQFHRQQRDPPLLPGSLSETRTNRNSPLIQRWPSVTLQWGSQVLLQVLLIKTLLFPGSGKLNLAPVEMEVEFHLSSLCRSYLGSVLSSLVAGRRELLSLLCVWDTIL